MDSVRWDRRLDGDGSQGCPMGGLSWVLRRLQSVAGVERIGDVNGFTIKWDSAREDGKEIVVS